ncbi:MAG: hypothetical protein AB1393_11850 [Candidatus Edwardsbacteria bacterium]
MESYEKNFIKVLRSVWDQIIKQGVLDVPKNNKDTYEMVNFYIDIFKLLRIEVSSVEHIFQQRFQQELGDYFIDYYEPQKMFIFIALIIHLALEENFHLLPLRSKLTETFYEVWMTGEIDTEIETLSNLIEWRIQYSLSKEAYSEFYYSHYKNPPGVFIQEILSEPLDKVREEESVVELKEEPKTLLKKLVGVSIAITILTFIGRWIGKRLGALKVWFSSDSSIQSMVSIGCAAGSLKFFGFCMERHKHRPKEGTSYRIVYRDALPDYLRETYDRMPSFGKFFYNFSNIIDEQILEVVEREEGKEKTWLILQKFFWLITQPYCDDEEDKGKIWKEFMTELSIDALLNREGPIGALFRITMGEKSEDEQKIDFEKVILVQKAIEILENYNIDIHTKNEEILLDIKQKIKEILQNG